MTAKFDPPAEIPHDEEFEWVNSWASTAPRAMPAEPRPDASALPHTSANGEARETEPAQVVSGVDAEVQATPAMTAPAIEAPAVEAAVDGNQDEVGKAPERVQATPETLAGLYMSFRGGVLQHMKKILRADTPHGSGRGESAIMVEPPDRKIEAPGASDETVASGVAGEHDGVALRAESPASEPAATEQVDAAPVPATKASSGIVHHLRTVMANRGVIRARVQAHLQRILHKASADLRLGIVGAQTRVLGHLKAILRQADASRSALANLGILRHLKPMLRSRPPAAAESAIAAVRPAQEAGAPSLPAHMRRAVLAHLRSVLRSRPPKTAEPVIMAEPAPATPATEPSVVAASVETPNQASPQDIPVITAPAIAPDQLDRDIADIIAVRDALLAETPVSFALNQIKTQFGRAWVRVFH